MTYENAEREDAFNKAIKEYDALPKELRVYREYNRSGDVVDLTDLIYPCYKIPFNDKRDVMFVIHLMAIGNYDIAISNMNNLKERWRDYGYKFSGVFITQIKAVKEYEKKIKQS